MNVKQTIAKLNSTSFKYFKDVKLSKLLPKFKPPIKKFKKYISKKYHYILTKEKDIYIVYEVCYRCNETYDDWEILRNNPFVAFANDKWYGNYYYVMKVGYRSKNEIDFRTTVGIYPKWNNTFRVKNFIPKENYWNYHGRNMMKLKDILSKPAFETAYKEGWSKYLPYADEIHPKGFICLGFEKYGKEFFKEFLKFKKYVLPDNLSTYKDFLHMAKNKNYGNYFDKKWLKLHDDWILGRKRKQDEIDAKFKKFISELSRLNIKEKDIKIEQMQTQEQLKKITSELNNCVGHGLYKPHEIWIAKVNKFKICVHYTDRIKQIKTFENNDIPSKLSDIIGKLIKKQVEQDPALRKQNG